MSLSAFRGHLPCHDQPEGHAAQSWPSCTCRPAAYRPPSTRQHTTCRVSHPMDDARVIGKRAQREKMLKNLFQPTPSPPSLPPVTAQGYECARTSVRSRSAERQAWHDAGVPAHVGPAGRSVIHRSCHFGVMNAPDVGSRTIV